MAPEPAEILVGNRTPDGPVSAHQRSSPLRRGAHFDIRESRTGGKVEGKRALRLHPVSSRIDDNAERLADQFRPQPRPITRANLWGNIGQQPAAVGFPEPALPAFLKAFEDILGTRAATRSRASRKARRRSIARHSIRAISAERGRHSRQRRPCDKTGRGHRKARPAGELGAETAKPSVPKNMIAEAALMHTSVATAHCHGTPAPIPSAIAKPAQAIGRATATATRMICTAGLSAGAAFDRGEDAAGCENRDRDQRSPSHRPRGGQSLKHRGSHSKGDQHRKGHAPHLPRKIERPGVASRFETASLRSHGELLSGQKPFQPAAIRLAARSGLFILRIRHQRQRAPLLRRRRAQGYDRCGGVALTWSANAPDTPSKKRDSKR